MRQTFDKYTARRHRRPDFKKKLKKFPKRKEKS